MASWVIFSARENQTFFSVFTCATDVLVPDISIKLRRPVRATVVPSMRPRSSSATTGRGLLLLSRLADEWDTELAEGGKTVWFTLTGDRDPWADTDEGGR